MSSLGYVCLCLPPELHNNHLISMNVPLALKLQRPQISHHISSRIVTNTQKEEVLAMSINAGIIVILLQYRRFGHDVVHMAVHH